MSAVGVRVGLCRICTGTVDDTEWERGLAALRRFVEARGSARVPAQAMAVGVPLGAWVASCREEYWSGGLTKSQVAELENFAGWDWCGRAQKRWERHLKALNRYADQNDTAMAPANAIFDGVRVGEWARAQRVSFGAGALPESLAERLSALPGWTWTDTADERWELGLRAVRSYAVTHGTADVSADAEVDGFRVGQWVARCREDHRAGSLSSIRIAALEDLPGWRWSASVERWERGVSALRAYIRLYGHASPPQKTVFEGFQLGFWVRNRRLEYRRGQLSAPRIQELEAVPEWSWTGTGPG